MYNAVLSLPIRLCQWLSQTPRQGATSKDSPPPHYAAFPHHWEEGGRPIRGSCQGTSWKSSYNQHDVFQERLGSHASAQGIINNPQPNDGDEY